MDGYISTEELAQLLDAWRTRIREAAPQPPADWPSRRRWLSRASLQARRWGIQPAWNRRTGTGQRLWPRDEVEAAIAAAAGPGNRTTGAARRTAAVQGWATRVAGQATAEDPIG